MHTKADSICTHLAEGWAAEGLQSGVFPMRFNGRADRSASAPGPPYCVRVKQVSTTTLKQSLRKPVRFEMVIPKMMNFASTAVGIA